MVTMTCRCRKQLFRLPFGRAVCDVAVDLYRCCDQLCSSFACAPASKNLPEVACRGPCHPTRDLARCCEVPAVQPESVQLLRASAAGEVLGVKRLTVMNANTSGAAPAATTALHFASLHGHVEVVRNLIDRRANVNALDDHGWAPLHLAAAAGRVGVMNLLIEAGAVPDQRSPDGTPHDVALRTLLPEQEMQVVAALAEHVRALRNEMNFTKIE
ncbi:unnamed protein product [Durusdinium trenchii]|uniref:Uncharacterized protein n=1 Tax=Durusdinium trenchii TaxID=1381693 RepID=A0ABP0KV10_9DINO